MLLRSGSAYVFAPSINPEDLRDRGNPELDSGLRSSELVQRLAGTANFSNARSSARVQSTVFFSEASAFDTFLNIIARNNALRFGSSLIFL
jgi:hypothetical protein